MLVGDGRTTEAAPSEHSRTIDAAPQRCGREILPGGLGTHLIRAVMDEVRYLAPPESDGNILELIKRTGGSR